MSDLIKQDLDREWQRFLSHLNTTYEDAYRDLRALLDGTGSIERFVLLAVAWEDGTTMHVQLGAQLRMGHTKGTNGNR